MRGKPVIGIEGLEIYQTTPVEAAEKAQNRKGRQTTDDWHHVKGAQR
jgi:hypothetical protein